MSRKHVAALLQAGLILLVVLLGALHGLGDHAGSHADDACCGAGQATEHAPADVPPSRGEEDNCPICHLNASSILLLAVPALPLLSLVKQPDRLSIPVETPTCKTPKGPPPLRGPPA